MQTPFNEDELRAQQLAGGGSTGGGIREFMPQQHRDFFSMLPYIFVGVLDERGWPLATMLTGAAGFVQSPDAVTLRINALPSADDPAATAFVENRDIALLGLDFSNRRRNRANGIIAAHDADGLTVAVRQSFGNCPQYIQLRDMHPSARTANKTEQFDHLDERATALITRADTFFIASRARSGVGAAHGADISHRGGRQGFVHVEGNVLTVPDFRGNRYFNTLGNLLGDSRAALLFLDFETGDILQIQGTAEIDWQTNNSVPEGAERIWRCHVNRAWWRRAAMPFTGTFLEFSPTSLGTGVWPA
ncbi:MAG TPA: pyridoxamine 5'-phosphate oxidase family protein [Xanthobacteraceae bacterium]|jgi:hypothetical protein|nr:pyridoxamine 5'-phosphate oxidase family protein [Xanthobacteraceae bacterium]